MKFQLCRSLTASTVQLKCDREREAGWQKRRRGGVEVEDRRFEGEDKKRRRWEVADTGDDRLVTACCVYRAKRDREGRRLGERKSEWRHLEG